MNERELILDECADECKALINQTLSKYKINYEEYEDVTVLEKIRNYITYLIDIEIETEWEMKELYYRIELPNGTILPHRFERFDQAENFMIRNDIYGYIIIA